NLSAMRLFQCDGVSDISPLGELIQMTDLDLKGCPSISDISPLAGLDSLARVDLRGCESIGEIAPLRGTVRRGGTVYVDDRLSPQYEQLRAEAAEAVRAAISQTGTSQVPSAEELPGVAGESDELRGRVVLPDGTPLADAEVVLCLPYNSVQIWNGGDRINAEDRRTARTDSGGRFSFRKPKLGELRWMLEMPPGLIRDATLRYLIVVRHGYGYAEVTPRQLAASPEITVQPWGKVEGRLLIGRAPGAHEPIRMECDLARSPVDRETPTVLRNNWSMTDAEGRFVFGMVAPGEWRIYQAIKVHGDRNGSMWARTQDVSVVVAPGETHQVDLGGVGRPVIGRLVMPTGGPLPVGYATVHMFPRDDETRGPGAAGMRFGNKAESDGTFRIEDVRPGPYTLRASLYELRPRDRDGIIRGHASYDFEVPGVPDGWSDEPLDLGTLEFELRK
ncbi:MAG: hypothetical protein KAX44_02495, partial [Candidatus Brocadiae bacterium]|nr:hypothetical protein [Candidatus Brocadiia bacterium]